MPPYLFAIWAGYVGQKLKKNKNIKTDHKNANNIGPASWLKKKSAL